MSLQPLAEKREQFRQRTLAKSQHEDLRKQVFSQPKRSPEALIQIASDAQKLFSSAHDADEILVWVGQEFGYRTAVACSMADLVLPHLVAQHLPWVDTLFLDTGYHFPETLGTRDAAETSMDLTIVDVRPKQSVSEQDKSFGKDLYQRDPALCCQLRKVEPLNSALGNYEVWITGVRRDESDLRADTPFVTWDAKNELVKVNPLAAWSFDEVVDYSARHNLITNPLIEEGYPSIGCAPCTRKVAPGEDPRSGRWAGSTKTECGLHT